MPTLSRVAPSRQPTVIQRPNHANQLRSAILVTVLLDESAQTAKIYKDCCSRVLVSIKVSVSAMLDLLYRKRIP